MRSLTAAVLVPLLELLGGSLAQASHNGSTPLYKNPSSPINDRVADLLSRMTIEDKTAQLLQGDLQNWLNITTNGFNASGLADMSANKSGLFYVGSPIPQDWLAAGIRQGQQYLVENTTLGIPAFVQTEGIHGFLIGNATIFNSPIGQAASFNPALVKKFARVVAQEAKALGVNQIFAPVQDLARELRHGRVEETFGEDAYLAGEMGHAYVTGLQENNVSAMVKHFAGFMVTEQGLNTGPAHYGERELRTTFLPSYQRAIIGGGAQAIMAAYHSLDGVPAVADYHLLTEILRDEWGYPGFVQGEVIGYVMHSRCARVSQSTLKLSLSTSCQQGVMLRWAEGVSTTAVYQRWFLLGSSTFLSLTLQFIAFSMPSLPLGCSRIRMPPMSSTTRLR